MRYLKYLLAALLATALLTGSIGCSPPQETVQRQPVDLHRGDLQVEVSSDGNVRLVEQREVFFETSGKITEIMFEKGDAVQAGDVIARLDQETLEDDIRSLEFAVRLAEIDITTARDAVSGAKIDLATRQDAVHSAEIDLAVAAAAVKSSEIDLATAQSVYQAAESAYQRVTYPYTYQTFAFSLPQAVHSINIAITQLEALKRSYGRGATGEIDDNAPSIPDQIDLLLNTLNLAEEKLTLGKGDNVFGSLLDGALLPYTSIWTLRDLQTAVDQAALTVDRMGLGIESAQGNVSRAAVALENAQRSVSSTELAVAGARRSATRAKVSLENARHNLQKTLDTKPKLTLAAPIDGTATAVYAEVGERRSSVNFLTAPLIQITDLSVMEVEANVDEIDIPLVALGQETIIEIDALPDVEIRGRVTYISPLSIVESGLVLYPVKIEFRVPPGAQVLAGMTATADIVVDERRDVLILGDRAIKRDADGNTVVLVLQADDTVETRVVELGASNGVETEIISGLTETDRVVIEIRIPPAAPSFGFGS